MKNSLLFKSFILYLACFITFSASGLEGKKPLSTHIVRFDALVRIGTNAIIGTNDITKGIFVLNGDAVIDGKVEEDAVIIKGNTQINGEVGKNLISIMGSVKIGPNAKIKENIILIGSKANISPTAEIGGSRIDVDFGKILPGIDGFLDWIRYSVVRLRPFAPQVKALWGIAIISLVFNLILLKVFPKTIDSCVDTIRQRPITSFLIGLLVSCFIAPIVVALLAFSVVGIVAIPFVICAVAIAVIFGRVATYRFVGHQVAKIRGSGISSPVRALILGSVLIYLVYMLPVIGLIGWCAIAIIALGASSVAAFDRIFRESPKSSSATQTGHFEPSKTVCMANTALSDVSKTEVNNVEPHQVSPQPTPLPQPPPLICQSIQSVDYSLLNRVGFWRRFVATLIDFCIFIIPFAVFHGAAWLLWMAYHFVLWAVSGGTVGDIVMRIKIVKENGAPMDWKTSFIRIMAAMLSAVALFIGFFWAGWTRDKKAWHDIIAGTIIVEAPKK